MRGGGQAAGRRGGEGEWRLGGSWWRGRCFKLSIFTAFADLSLQNHFSGDAGHLTVGHCVGAVPATQRSVSSIPQDQK